MELLAFIELSDDRTIDPDDAAVEEHENWWATDTDLMFEQLRPLV